MMDRVINLAETLTCHICFTAAVYSACTVYITVYYLYSVQSTLCNISLLIKDYSRGLLI